MNESRHLLLMRQYDGDCSEDLELTPEDEAVLAGLEQLSTFIETYAEARAAEQPSIVESVMSKLDEGPALQVVEGDGVRESTPAAASHRGWLWGGMVAAAAGLLFFVTQMDKPPQAPQPMVAMTPIKKGRRDRSPVDLRSGS